MTSRECPQTPLVEALHDGRLGPPERASVERHLATCSACRDLARDLDAIRGAIRAPQDAVSPLAHQRARQALLGRASMPPAASVRPWIGGQAFLQLAAVVVLAIGMGWIGGRATAPSSRPELALHVPVPPAPTETTVRPSEGARFEHVRSPGLDVVTLASGALDVQVRLSDPRKRFVVRTTDAEIHAKRASFRVEADQGRIRSVTVESESVEVRYAGAVVVMTSGGSWRTGDAADALPSGAAADPTTPTSASPEAAASALPASEVPAPKEHATPEPPPETRPELPDGSPAARPAASPAAAPAAGPATKGDARARPPVASRNAPSSAPSAAASSAGGAARSSAREFAEAMRAVGAGDYEGGASRLEAFASDHPNDPRADEAEYVRAAALQRAGRTAEAAAAAKRYLATRPNGAHRVEAKQIAGQ